jgi:hypothetical protein
MNASWESSAAIVVPATVIRPKRRPYAIELATTSATFGPGITTRTVVAATKAR